jgi:arsenate reductase
MTMNQKEAEQKTYNVMFTCVANSARSILAEAAMNSMGRGRFRAFSAGSDPSDHVHPLTLRVLEKLRFDTGFARPKSWEEFSGPDAPKMDFVFSVCDEAGGEDCPDWPGHPLTARWGLPDPKRAEGTEAQSPGIYQQLQDAVAPDGHFPRPPGEFVRTPCRQDRKRASRGRVSALRDFGSLVTIGELSSGWSIPRCWRKPL